MASLILTPRESEDVLFQIKRYRRLSVGDLEREVGLAAAERMRRCRRAYREMDMDAEFRDAETEVQS